MNGAFATLEDVQTLWRGLSAEEMARCEALLPLISDSLRQEARFAGKDLDQMLVEGEVLEAVVKSVVVDVVARTLMTSTDREPMTQTSESALGYSFSGTYLVPGGGLFIKKSELARLGIRRQRMGVLDLWQGSKEFQ